LVLIQFIVPLNQVVLLLGTFVSVYHSATGCFVSLISDEAEQIGEFVSGGDACYAVLQQECLFNKDSMHEGHMGLLRIFVKKLIATPRVIFAHVLSRL
jgi:hypothetical protein